ncbi:MAG: hypothetical protein V4509_02120 [Patescibacteria group bacterium]
MKLYLDLPKVNRNALVELIHMFVIICEYVRNNNFLIGHFEWRAKCELPLDAGVMIYLHLVSEDPKFKVCLPFPFKIKKPKGGKVTLSAFKTFEPGTKLCDEIVLEPEKLALKLIAYFRDQATG